MSARVLAREFGVVLRCNADGCEARFQTANVYVKHNRSAAKAAGWIRGGRPGTRKAPGTKRHDYCPEHAPAELAAIAALTKAKAERQKARADKAKQRLAAQLERERTEAQGASASP